MVPESTVTMSPPCSQQRSQRVVGTPPGDVQPGDARQQQQQQQQGTPGSAGRGGSAPQQSPYSRSPYSAAESPVVTTPEQLKRYMVPLLIHLGSCAVHQLLSLALPFQWAFSAGAHTPMPANGQ